MIPHSAEQGFRRPCAIIKCVQPDAALQLATAQLNRVREEIGKIIVGQQEVVDGVLICLLAGGHVLLEGVPGLGKTTLLRTLARVLHLKYSRIQFTPDLMPADIVGSMIIDTEGGAKALRFQPGPIFAHLVLADEINRATPKTQSALLEAMQERTVTSGTTTHRTGTAVPGDGDAESDRNGRHLSAARSAARPVPDEDPGAAIRRASELSTIVERTIQKEEVAVEPVLDREEIHGAARRLPPGSGGAARAGICHRSGDGDAAGYRRQAHELASKYIRYGSSPRGAQALVECGRVLALMHGRLHLSIEDVQTVAPAVLRHRIILNFDAHAEGQTPETILEQDHPQRDGSRRPAPRYKRAEDGPLIDTAFLEKLERLTIHWQKSLPGLVGGHNTSRFAGAGQEFLDHRNFHHGDDLRAVNWRAYCGWKSCSSRCSSWSRACRCACCWTSASR